MRRQLRLPRRREETSLPRRLLAACIALGLTLMVGACARSSRSVVELDGSPRHPDDQGVVTDVSTRRVTLDGKKTYEVDAHLEAFSGATLSAIPLLGRKGTYVQVGLDGDTVAWLAGYGAVVEFPGQPAVAFHNGTIASFRKGDAIFADGSVFAVARDVEAPQKGARVTAEIDVTKKKIVRFTPTAGAAGPAAP